MKAVISNKILLSRTAELDEIIKDKLTFKFDNPKFSKFGGAASKPIVERLYKFITKDIVTIPIGSISLIPDDYEIVDKRVSITANIPSMNITLRPSQQDIYDKVDDSCIINAIPGFGKTITALAIAYKLQLKTLIVCHTVKLRVQWEREIEKIFGIKAGVIGSGRQDVEGFPIVVANVQTLTKIATKYSRSFGLLALDEVHHTPATTFSNIVNGSCARYKIGLSGTLKRKDGRHVYLPQYISDIVYVPDRENVMDPTICVVDTGIKLPGSSSVAYADRATALSELPAWRDIVRQFAEAQAERGHSVLVVSDRVEFLEYMHETTPNSACITGKTPQADSDAIMLRIANSEISILYGSISIFKEGISESVLSCVIFGNTISNDSLVIQLIGRVLRLHKNKLNPEIIDLKLSCGTGYNQYNTRMKGYNEMGYKVVKL